MNDNDDFGGAWVYPSKFSALPTPPNAKDADGNPLSTNVAPGEAGSRVIFWAHGSAFAITQAKDFVWLFAQMLSEQTGQVGRSAGWRVETHMHLRSPALLQPLLPLRPLPPTCLRPSSPLKVVLLGEYGLTSSDVAPAQLNGWTKTYTKLVEVYGAENVIIAGDSAGGCLSLATLLNTSTSLPPPGEFELELELPLPLALEYSIRVHSPTPTRTRTHVHTHAWPLPRSRPGPLLAMG